MLRDRWVELCSGFSARLTGLSIANSGLLRNQNDAAREAVYFPAGSSRPALRRDGPFGCALSKIPTSRAKNAREMGHPRFSFLWCKLRPSLHKTILRTWGLGADLVPVDAGGEWHR